ncbi:nose resistant to fluoxetine protein 6-like [Ptychodera flava]|uniref:nose resistant to fluoxetine protein 6-like n=1 Tax=Ptychodera flava TaxID=63121 RepID=UPI003969E81F
MANLKINVALLMVAVLQVSAQEQRNQNIMDLMFRVLVESVQSNSTKAFENISPQCYKDTLQFVIDAAFQQTYAREMYYSSGILRQDYDLTWNLKDFGDFRMCRGAEVSVDGNAFTGKYCLSHSLIAPSSYASIAVCYPSSCTDQDIQIFVFEGVKTIPSVPSDVTTETECAVRSYQLRLQDYFAIVLSAMLAAVVIAGTIYDAIQRISKEVEVSPPSPKKDEPPVTNSELAASTTELVLEEMKEDGNSSRSRASVCKEKLANALLAFSMIDAGGKILNTSPSKGSIGCLNGIRVLSMFWIILYHVWLFLALAVTYVGNPRYVFEEVANRWTAELLWQGDLGVEAFFVLSGLLVSYTTLKQLDKCGGPRKHNWLLFYFHRFWRLTPAYAFVLMMYTTLTLHMGNGVHWSYWFGLQESCQKTWWANMLYIHNLYPFPGSTSECMGWTWYLSVDMQLFILSPIFIILLYK